MFHIHDCLPLPALVASHLFFALHVFVYLAHVCSSLLALSACIDDSSVEIAHCVSAMERERVAVIDDGAERAGWAGGQGTAGRGGQGRKDFARSFDARARTSQLRTCVEVKRSVLLYLLALMDQVIARHSVIATQDWGGSRTTVGLQRTMETAIPVSRQGTRVYTEYDVASPPRTPGPEWVRFVLISDTHSQTTHIPDGDVLLHAGDLTTLGQPDDLGAQVEWLKSLAHEHKIFICGNHDFSACTDQDFYETRGRQLNAQLHVQDSAHDVARAKQILNRDSLCEKALTYLNNQPHQFTVQRAQTSHYQWTVWGSPWSPQFHDWAWNYKRGVQARHIYKDIPKHVDVLITHTPPHKLGALDTIHDGSSVGCEELTRRLTAPASEHDSLRPKLHVFGHIHEARGVHLLEQPAFHHGDLDESLLVNAALVEYDQHMWNNHRICKCTPSLHRPYLPLPSCPPTRAQSALTFFKSNHGQRDLSLVYRRMQVSAPPNPVPSYGEKPLTALPLLTYCRTDR